MTRVWPCHPWVGLPRVPWGKVSSLTKWCTGLAPGTRVKLYFFWTGPAAYLCLGPGVGAVGWGVTSTPYDMLPDV